MFNTLLTNFAHNGEKNFTKFKTEVRQKWNNQKQNFKVGYAVLLREDSIRNKWPMAKNC